MRRIIIKKGRQMFHAHLGISYTTTRDNFERYVAPFPEDIRRYGTHSIKSGAASNVGCRELDGDLIDKHAGWRNVKSKQRYIKVPLRVQQFFCFWKLFVALNNCANFFGVLTNLNGFIGLRSCRFRAVSAISSVHDR